VNKRIARYFFIMMLGITNLSAMIQPASDTTPSAPAGSPDRGDAKDTINNDKKNPKASSIIDGFMFKKYRNLMVMSFEHDKGYLQMLNKNKNNAGIPLYHQNYFEHCDQLQDQYNKQLDDILNAITNKALVEKVLALMKQAYQDAPTFVILCDRLKYRLEKQEQLIKHLDALAAQFYPDEKAPATSDTDLIDLYIATVKEGWECDYNLDEVILSMIATSEEGEDDPNVQELWEQAGDSEAACRLKCEAIHENIQDEAFVFYINQLHQAKYDADKGREFVTIAQKIEHVREVMQKFIRDIETCRQRVHVDALAEELESATFFDAEPGAASASS